MQEIYIECSQKKQNFISNTKPDNSTKWRNVEKTEMPLHLAVATEFRVHG